MQRDIAALKDVEFDVVVVGGGIYGAWTAYDAALRGLKVAIIDQGDWASGTSSASSKLIHGGLRYLEHLDFKLVKKSLLEREMLLKTAPHRVWPLRFGIPLYGQGRLGAFKFKTGLMLYDWLAGGLPKSKRHRHLSALQMAEQFPFLDDAQLKAGFTYLDAQTDDARFVLELIDGALQSGAVCVNYCRAHGLIQENGRVTGLSAEDAITLGYFKIHAKQVVDTVGRWSARFQQQDPGYRLAKGIHLILPSLKATEALLLTARSDGRVFFIIPWYGMTLLGTTDTDYSGDLDQLRVEADEMAYLLNEANGFLRTQWSKQDVRGAFAGVRVMKADQATNPSAVSRDWMLMEPRPGLLASIGGKLTSAREDASVIVDKVCENLGHKDVCSTFGKPLAWLRHNAFDSVMAETAKRAGLLGIDAESVQWLVRRFGENAGGVIALCEEKPELAVHLRPGLPFIKAELVFSARHEMVVHLDDLLRRRMPLLILAKLDQTELMQMMAWLAPELGWGDVRVKEEIRRCLQTEGVIG